MNITTIRHLCCISAIVFSFPVFAQSDFTDKLNTWKTQFAKEDIIAWSHKEIVSFSLNADPKPGEGKVKATVNTEITVVPVRDFIKFTDGLFFNDEVCY